MIKAVMFDAIDTLFCAYPDKIGMYHRIIEERLGFEVEIDKLHKAWDESILEAELKAREEIKHRQNIGAWDSFNTRILEKIGYPGSKEEDGKVLHYESWCNPDNFRLFEDVLPTLKKLREKSIKIGCISNEMEDLRKFFTKFDLEEYFDVIVISEEIGCEKPNKKIFEMALEKVGLGAEEVIFVGDSEISDYEGSDQAGLVPVLIDREAKCLDNITKISSLTEISEYVERLNIHANTIA